MKVSTTRQYLATAFLGLVFLAGPVSAKERVMLRQRSGAPLQRQTRTVDFGLTQAQMLAIFDATGGNVDFRNIVSIDVSSHAAALNLKGLPGFDSIIQPNVPPPFNASFTPDPALAGEWWIDALNVPEAWETVSGRGVTIADCDSGFYVEESDLRPNFLMDYAYDLSDKDAPTVVNDGNFVFHGTAVTSIMAGAADGQGTNGIAYDAKIVPLQNFNYDSAKDDLDKEEATSRCILRALTVPGVRIIVLENQTAEGSSETFAGTREAVKLALSSGVTIVSAAGNASKELVAERDDDTGSIIVGALNQQGGKAYFSNFGARVSVAAFGENLKTLFGPNGLLDKFGGTSGATPQVAATVALMLEANPELTPAQVKTALVNTRRQTDGTNQIGGQLDAGAAVNQSRAMAEDAEQMRRQAALKAKVLQILENP